MMGALAQIIARDWRVHKLRLALTVAGIALGVSVFFSIQTANRSLVNSLNNTIEKLAGRSTLQIVSAESGFSEDVYKEIRSTTGIEAAEPVTETIAETELGTNTRILILGLDTTSDLSLYTGTVGKDDLIVKNPIAFQNRKDSVAITRSLAEKYGLKDGDKLLVRSQLGPTTLTVRGIFSSSGIGDVYDGNVAVMDIYSAQETFGRGKKIDRIDIANAPGVTVEELQARIAEKLPAGIQVVRPNLRGQGLENSVTTLHVGFTIMSILALTIGVFLIFNSFSISVSQRWKEIAVLRALGVERGSIKRMFLAEAAVLGLIGSFIGIGFGVVMARAALGVIIRVTATVYGVVTSPATIEFDRVFAAEAFFLGLVVSLIAAWLPARSAANLEPALALRNIETRQSDPAKGRIRDAAGLLIVIAGLAAIRLTPAVSGSYFPVVYSFTIQVGMVMLLPRMLTIGAKLMRSVMNRLFGAEGVMAVDTMARSPRRTVATVAAIMVGLSFVLSNSALVQSQKEAINRSIEKALAADMLVTSSEQLHSRTYHFTESTARTISNLPEVAIADALRVTATEIDGAEVTILAHDMNAYFDIAPDLLDAGDAAAARSATSRGEGVLISNNLSFRWNVKLGDLMTIRSPRGELRLPVVGMLDYYRSENGTIFLDRELYKRFWDDTDVDYVFLDLKPGVDRAALKEKIQSAIAGTQTAFIYTHDEYKSWVMRLLDQFFAMMYMQMIVAAIVATVGLVNTMLISVAERKRELGIFRAVGGVRRQVMKLVLLEAIAIAVIGFVSGAIMGAMNAYFLVNTAARVVAGFNLQMKFPYYVATLSIPAVILVAMISAWFPARRAARLNIVEAIGYE